jgi:AraC family ethanolamine operon transcriptional activator
MNDDTTPFFHGRFHDVQEMVSCHPVLDMSYLQLGRGHFVGELSGFPLPNGVFWRSRANLGVVGSCDIPKGFLLVGVATLCGDYWHDRPVAAETMAVGNSCSGLLHRTSEGHGAWVWLIRHERYLELAETLGLKLANLEKPQILYEVLPGRISRLRELIGTFFAHCREGLAPGRAAWFETALVRATLHCLAEREDTRVDGHTRRGRSVARAARHILHENSGTPLCMATLCDELRVPERTLRAHFSEQFHISPVSYHLRLRLNLVRQKLLQTTTCKGAISQAATEFGFWHMGRFGQQYRSLFGEAPSATLRREASFGSGDWFDCP